MNEGGTEGEREWERGDGELNLNLLKKHSLFIIIIIIIMLEIGYSAAAQSLLTATSPSWGSSNSPVSASRVARITEMCNHARLILYF